MGRPWRCAVACAGGCLAQFVVVVAPFFLAGAASGLGAGAAAALHYLTTQGIKPTTLRGICYGDTRPYKPGIDPASQAANRRVEFVFHRPEVMSYSVVY